jgi:hypothetical protein
VITAIPVGIGLFVLERWVSLYVSSKASATKAIDKIETPPTPLNLRFVRTGIEHISLDGDIPRRINSASQQGHVALVAVFEPYLADTELRAAISFNDPTNSQVDRACWMYERSHIAKVKRGERKELLIGYKQFNGFVQVETDYERERDRSLKIKLLNGNELIADVQLLSTTSTEAQRHKFKITLEPTFGIEKISDTST